MPTLPHLQRPIKLRRRMWREGTCYLVSEKMDGIRAYWWQGQLWSRQGLPIPNAHIQAAVASWGLPDGVDGELCCRGADGRISLAAAQSVVMSHNSTAPFEFHAFASITDRFDELGSFAQRIPQFHTVKQRPVGSLDEALARLDAIALRGGEGICIKEAGKPYAMARCFKLKPHYLL